MRAAERFADLAHWSVLGIILPLRLELFHLFHPLKISTNTAVLLLHLTLSMPHFLGGGIYSFHFKPLTGDF